MSARSILGGGSAPTRLAMVHQNQDGAAGDERVGRVVAVSGAQVVVLLHDDDSTRALALQIGGLLKVRTSADEVFGSISSMSIPVPAEETGGREMKICELDLVGEASAGQRSGERRFQRGISAYPALGDSVVAADKADLALVYGHGAGAHTPIGTVQQDSSLPAAILTDELLGKHFAVLGTTGSGKSCAVTLILANILAQHPHGHIVLLDMHGEYASAFGAAAEVITPDTLELPYWLLNFEEAVQVLTAGRDEDRQVEATILSEVIVAAKRQFLGRADQAEIVTVDSPVPYRLGELNKLLDDAAGRLNRSRDAAPFQRLKDRLAALQADRRFAFMFPRLAVRDNAAQILGRLFRVPLDGKPITILDLSGVPSEALGIVVSVVSRLAFDFALWCERRIPILLLCEEAHRYAPREEGSRELPSRKALARIAKEGRKYGVALGVISQRPADLDAGVLSQCSTIFALRLTNQRDRDHIAAAIPEFACGLLDFLPSLRNAEAIVLGEGISVPMRVCLSELPADRRPLSTTASFSAGWQAPLADGGGLLDQVVARWRNRRR